MTDVPNEPDPPAPDAARPGQVHPIDPTRRRAKTTPARTDRVPPHNLPAEESLLGAMLLSRDAISAAGELTTAADFYKPAYGHIFEAITTLDAAGEPADPVTVADWLTRHDLIAAVGGPAVLTDLQGNTPAIGNAARYATIVAEHALLRRIIGAAGEIAELAYNQPDNVTLAVDQAEQLLFRITDPRRAAASVTMRDAISELLDVLAVRFESGSDLPGITTGFVDLDRITYGHQARQLIVVGARPGMGKSGFAGALAANAAAAAYPVIFFSAEMSREEIAERYLAAASGVDLDRLKRGNLADKDWTAISRAIGPLSEMPVDLYDEPTVTLMTMRAHARRAIRKWGRSPLIIVDYLQLMTPLERAENRNVEVSELSRGLKKLAGELDTPVIALSQLSRNLEQRRDKRPILSDLRDSGAVEQDADKVLFLYRDEVYNPKTKDKGVMEVHVAKHRGGPTGLARLAYFPHRSQFTGLVQADQ